jgi:hypothetical protein
MTTEKPLTDQQFSLFEFEAPVEVERPKSEAPMGKFSNFVVYVDESGDHGMQNIDKNYPVFVLAFCIFHKRYYSENVVPALQKFKFNNFGHDIVILHERDIRKESGIFKFKNQSETKNFISRLTGIINSSNFILVSCVIDKIALLETHAGMLHPYHIALAFCLETLYEFLQEKRQHEAITHIVFECRGAKEDKDLELEFRRICAGANKFEKILPLEIVFADKKANSCGLQFADLVARPIGLSHFRPNQENRAFEILKRKFFCSGGRVQVGSGFEDWGLKIYPNAKKRKAPVKLTEAVAPTGNSQST